MAYHQSWWWPCEKGRWHESQSAIVVTDRIVRLVFSSPAAARVRAQAHAHAQANAQALQQRGRRTERGEWRRRGRGGGGSHECQSERGGKCRIEVEGAPQRVTAAAQRRAGESETKTEASAQRVSAQRASARREYAPNGARGCKFQLTRRQAGASQAPPPQVAYLLLELVCGAWVTC